MLELSPNLVELIRGVACPQLPAAIPAGIFDCCQRLQFSEVGNSRLCTVSSGIVQLGKSGAIRDHTPNHQLAWPFTQYLRPLSLNQSRHYGCASGRNRHRPEWLWLIHPPRAREKFLVLHYRLLRCGNAQHRWSMDFSWRIVR